MIKTEDKKDKPVSCEEFRAIMDELAEQINRTGIKYDLIVGLSRGGIVPAGYLSYCIGYSVPVICLHEKIGHGACILYGLNLRNVLVVDNIATGGQSLTEATNELEAMHGFGVHVGRIHTCVVHSRAAAAVDINYVGRVIDDNEVVGYHWE